MILVISCCKLFFGYTNFIKYAKYPPSVYLVFFFAIFSISLIRNIISTKSLDIEQLSREYRLRRIFFYSIIYFIVFFICTINVKIGSSLFFQGIDGKYQLVNNANSIIYNDPILFNTSNVLQGLGAERPFNYNYKLDPGYYLLTLGKSFGVALAHSFWATSLFASLIYFLTRLKLKQNLVLTSAIVTPLYMLIPTSITISLIPQLTPHLIYSIALFVAISGLIITEKETYRTLFWNIFCTLFSVIYLILLNPTFMLIFGLPLILLSLITLISKRQNSSTFKMNFYYFGALLLSLLLIRVHIYLFGQIYDTSVYGYKNEYSWGDTVINKFASSIYLERKGAVFLYLLALVLSIFFASKKLNQNLKIFFKFYLIYVIFIMIFGILWLQNPDKWLGIRPVYLEMGIWVFIFPIVMALLSMLSNSSFVLYDNRKNISARIFGIENLVIISLIINMISFNFNEYPNSIIGAKKLELTNNDISNKLLKLKINNGDEFRGRFFLITPEFPEKNFTQSLLTLKKEIGFIPWRNDLWDNQIPTLNQYGQLISRRSYFLIKNSFSSNSEVQVRNSINVSNYNSFSALLGVKYILTDDSKILLDRNVSLLEKLYVDNTEFYFVELIQANLGQFSPLNQNIIPNFDSEKQFRDSTQMMLENDFYVKRDITDGVSLVKAKDAKIVYKNSQYIIDAQSEGTSIIILPIEFSHCYQVKNFESNSSVTFFEANWGLIGLKFEKRLDISLTYYNGLFSSPACKLSKTVDIS